MKQHLCLFLLQFTSIFCYEYQRAFEGYYSQKGQDKFLHEEIFKNKYGGVFVEIGAHDGISFSNTYFFEKYLGWSGICIEPNPDIFAQLKQNRSCWCENICITDCVGQMPFLKCSGYLIEMYSGLLPHYDPRHLARIDAEIAQYGGSKEIIYVNCIPCSLLLEKYGISYIDILSIDIEGGEAAALKTINLETTPVNVIIIENNFNEDDIRQYLSSKGYRRIKRLGKDDIYQREDLHE